MGIEDRLADLGIELPDAPKPVASYVPAVRTGSLPVIPELGFPLGTRGQMFVLDESHPNVLAPGKRPRTTLSPSLACLSDGRSVAFGTPGGDQQDQWTSQFFLDLADFGVSDLQTAIDAIDDFSFLSDIILSGFVQM